MISVLLADPFATRPEFVSALHDLDPPAAVRIWQGGGEPSADLVVTWALPDDYPAVPAQVRAILCFGAGVDQLVEDRRVPGNLAIIRSLDEGQANHMAAYVLAAAYALLVGLPRHHRAQQARHWGDSAVSRRQANELTVTVLGTGFIGSRIISRLVAPGFTVRCWSRTGRAFPGTTSFSGTDRLAAAARGSDLLVNVLALTPATRHVVNRQLLGLLAPGAGVVNIGRGGHLVESDLREALDEGRIEHGWLDTVEQEPPPPDSWMWAHPRLTLTPHVAGPPDIRGAARSLAIAIAAIDRGDAPPGLVRGTLG